MGGKKVFELILELGHRSAPLKQRSANGYTHKWTAFVRGINDSKIEHCIQKVVFQLHDSFDNPSRQIHEPPFQIKETGYAGFEIPIEIYFKNREKPNHLVFVHDLCLLKNKPNDASTIEKIKFINPNREFEKLLIKSGAQLLKVPVKKERSDSPPAKKQKSSSLIPSKDMSKQLQPQLNHQETHNDSSNNLSLLTDPPKPSSKQFIDVFGAPLLYHSNNSSSNTTSSASTNSSNNSNHTNSNSTNTGSSISHPASTHNSVSNTSVTNPNSTNSLSNHNSTSSNNNNNNKSEKRDEHHFDLQSIQSKIASISDSERLQRIVDIVEGGGEWYNVTPKKFEFDLKRLDRKTLLKIERCLQY